MCSTCSAGYSLSNGACKQASGRTFSPAEHCAPNACSATLYHFTCPVCVLLLLQAQCSVHVVNCQAYSATNGCACTACTAGYRLASGSCEPVG